MRLEKQEFEDLFFKFNLNF